MEEGTSFAGKMQAILPTLPSGELLAFLGDGLVLSKVQIALMMRRGDFMSI